MVKCQNARQLYRVFQNNGAFSFQNNGSFCSKIIGFTRLFQNNGVFCSKIMGFYTISSSTGCPRIEGTKSVPQLKGPQKEKRRREGQRRYFQYVFEIHECTVSPWRSLFFIYFFFSRRLRLLRVGFFFAYHILIVIYARLAKMEISLKKNTDKFGLFF